MSAHHRFPETELRIFIRYQGSIGFHVKLPPCYTNRVVIKIIMTAGFPEENVRGRYAKESDPKITQSYHSCFPRSSREGTVFLGPFRVQPHVWSLPVLLWPVLVEEPSLATCSLVSCFLKILKSLRHVRGILYLCPAFQAKHFHLWGRLSFLSFLL